LRLKHDVDRDDEYWIQHDERYRIGPTGLMPTSVTRCLLDAGVSVNCVDTALHIVINEMFNSQPDYMQTTSIVGLAVREKC